MKISNIDSLLSQLRGMSDVAAGKPAAANAVAPAKVGFGDALKSAIDQVSQAQKSAGVLSRQFEAGATEVNLSDVMLSMQKANISFQAMVQVRNKVVSAYQEIMNMQV